MRKITGLLLAFIIAVTGAVTVRSTGFAEDEATDGTLETAKFVLKYIGAVDEKIPEGDITRGGFAEIAAKALKLSEKGKNVYFSDVDRSYVNAVYINALAENGIISLDETEFRPDETVTYPEAVKIMLTAAGYGPYAEVNGGYPTGYIAAAGRTKLFSSAENHERLTYNDAIKIVYNAMFLGLYTAKTFMGDVSRYEVSDDTLFGEKWGFYRDEGVLRGFCGGSDSDTAAGENRVLIDDCYYTDSDDLYLYDMFLDDVEFVFERESRNAEPKLIYAKSKRNDDLVIKSSDIEGYSRTAYELTYVANGGNRLSRKRIDPGSRFFYNGSIYRESIETVMNEFLSGEKRGTVRLKDSDYDGEYDTVIIVSYRSIAVNGRPSEKDTYYSMYEPDKSFTAGEYENVTVFNRLMKKAELINFITPGVLTVAEAKDKRFAQVIICDEIINATVDSINASGAAESEITASGKKYKLDRNVEKNEKILIGRAYSFIIDRFGYIVYVTPGAESKEYQIGLIVRAEVCETVESTLKIKLLSHDTGNMEVYKVCSGVRVDGVVMKGSDYGKKVLNALGEYSNVPIRYRLNGNGEICDIDSPTLGTNEDPERTLSKKCSGDTGEWQFVQNSFKGAIRRLGTRIIYNPDYTVVFSVPRADAAGWVMYNEKYPFSANRDDHADNKYLLDGNGNKVQRQDWMYSAKPDIQSYASLYMDTYSYDADNPYEGICVIYYDIYHRTEMFYLYDSVSEQMNENGEPIKVVNCYETGVLKSFEIEDESMFDGFVQGDVFTLSLVGNDEKITSAVKVYDSIADYFCNPKRPAGESTSGITHTVAPDYWYSGTYGINTNTGKITQHSYYDGMQMSKGTVLRINGDIADIDWDGDFSTYEERVYLGNVPKLMIDRSTDRNKISVCSMSDIPDYETAGNAAARIILHSSNLVGKNAYIYIN